MLLGGTGGFACRSGFLQLLPQAARIASLLFAVLGLCLVSHMPVRAQSPGALPGTAHWDFPHDIATQQYIELRDYFEARIAAASQRDRF